MFCIFILDLKLNKMSPVKYPSKDSRVQNLKNKKKRHLSRISETSAASTDNEDNNITMSNNISTTSNTSTTNESASLFNMKNMQTLVEFFNKTKDESFQNVARDLADIYTEGLEELKNVFDTLEAKVAIRIKEEPKKIKQLMQSMSQGDDECLVKKMLDASLRQDSELFSYFDEKYGGIEATAYQNGATETSDDWTVGSMVEAKDTKSKTSEWYSSKIVEKKGDMIKIHYSGWNSRHDIWLNRNSELVRPANKANSLIETSKHKVGDQILAKNPDTDNYHRAKISQLRIKGDMLYYQVLFFEEEFLKFLVRYDHVRKMDEEPDSDQCFADMSVNDEVTSQVLSENETSSEASASASVPPHKAKKKIASKTKKSSSILSDYRGDSAKDPSKIAIKVKSIKNWVAKKKSKQSKIMGNRRKD